MDKLCWVVLLVGVLQLASFGTADGETISTVSILIKPYLMEKTTDAESNSTDTEYEGFIPDMLELMSNVSNKVFDLHAVEDGQYGVFENKSWNGMIGEIVDKKAELIAAPMVITIDREDVVDFTFPFKVSETMILLQERDAGERHIRDLKDLVTQDEIKYGVRENGVVARELEESTVPEFEEAWITISNSSDFFVATNQEGLAKVAADYNFAFVAESSFAEWALRHPPCDLDGIKSGLTARKYAFAVPNQHKLRDDINKALVEIQSDGSLNALTKKWWPDDCSKSTTVQVANVVVFVIIAFCSIFILDYSA